MDEIEATQETIQVGSRVVWLECDTGKPEHGTVRWVGTLETFNQSECSVGVELDEPVGYGDGKWGDMEELFKSKPRHGVIVPAMGLVLEENFNMETFVSSQARSRDPPLNVDDRVVWLERASPQHATVRWVGVLAELASDWTIGIEFDKPEGKMDGVFNKSRLFECKPGHGMLVNAMGLIREDVFMGNYDDGFTDSFPEDQGGHGYGDGVDQSTDSQAANEPTSSSGSKSSTTVRAPTLAECEVQKWYDALEESHRHKARLKKDKKRKRFSFRRRANGAEDDDRDMDRDDDSYMTEVFDVGKSPTATLPRKKTKRGGLFALFRWIRGKTRKRSGNDGNPVVMRRSLSLDAAEGVHVRAVSVTSVSESFQYVPQNCRLQVPSDGFPADNGSLYEMLPTPMASPVCARSRFAVINEPDDPAEVLPEEVKVKLTGVSAVEMKPEVPVVIVTPVMTPVITPVMTPVPSGSRAKKRRAPPPPLNIPGCSSSAPSTVTQQRAYAGHHRSVSLVVGRSSGAVAHCHVKGKRKAPLPPAQVVEEPKEVVRELRRSNPVLPACESKPYKNANLNRQMCKSVSSEVLHPVRAVARTFSSRSLGVVDDVGVKKEVEVQVSPRESLADILKALDNLHSDIEEQTAKKQPETVDLRTLHDMVQSLVKQFCGKTEEDVPASPKPPEVPPKPRAPLVSCNPNRVQWAKRRSASLGAEPAPPRLPEKRSHAQKRGVNDWIRYRSREDTPPKIPKGLSGDDEDEESIYELIGFGVDTPPEAESTGSSSQSSTSVAELRRLYGGGCERRLPQPIPVYENIRPFSYIGGVPHAPPSWMVAPPPCPVYRIIAQGGPRGGYLYSAYPPVMTQGPGEEAGQGRDYETVDFGGGARAGRKSFVAAQVKRIEAAKRWGSNIGTASGGVVHSQSREPDFEGSDRDTDDEDDGDEWHREDSAVMGDENSVTVNGLLHKLEAAICKGRHEKAAALARQLAHLKINCTVKRLRTVNNADPKKLPIILNLYVEDRVSHHGPIPIQAFPAMTVGELKTKIYQDFEFPPIVQRWILGKSLVTDDDVTLDSKDVDKDGCPIYLYLVSLDECSSKPSSDFQSQGDFNSESHTYENVLSPGYTDNCIGTATNGSEEQGWQCESCTLINVPTRPGCEVCSAPRPNDYVIPDGYTPNVREAERLRKEQESSPYNAQAREREEEERMCGYRRLMELEELDVITNTEPVECPVCFAKVDAGQGIQLRDCLHNFCRECLCNAVQYSEEAVVKCPYRDEVYSCPSSLQEREIRVLVSEEVFERHLRKSMVAAENQTANSFHCRTPNCPGWCEFEDTVNEFPCPACESVNCLTCQAIHEGLNCRMYQERLAMDAADGDDEEARKTVELLEVMLQKGEAIRCPKCRVILMKKWGCDWVRCSVCQTEICWVTRGARWGPNGKGDSSGGCKCGVGGKKCHPLCNYCH